MIRLIDIALSLGALIFLTPIFFGTIVFLRCTGEGEIFYRQQRIGKNFRKFELLKFATMLKDSPKIGTGSVTLKNDPRILPAGKFLRRTKINELPQLINVLFGNISLIGPRPLTADRFDNYSEVQRKTISSVVPGLSGVGSIFFRDEERFLNDPQKAMSIYQNIIAPYKGDLECWFVNNKNIKLYFILIFLTVIAVLKIGDPNKILVNLGAPKSPKELC
jgi:lipopolysaccharide/colanic/teichoic acid biosynthesis glycosyltransferase